MAIRSQRTARRAPGRRLRAHASRQSDLAEAPSTPRHELASAPGRGLRSPGSPRPRRSRRSLPRSRADARGSAMAAPIKQGRQYLRQWAKEQGISERSVEISVLYEELARIRAPLESLNDEVSEADKRLGELRERATADRRETSEDMSDLESRRQGLQTMVSDSQALFDAAVTRLTELRELQTPADRRLRRRGRRPAHLARGGRAADRTARQAGAGDPPPGQERPARPLARHRAVAAPRLPDADEHRRRPPRPRAAAEAPGAAANGNGEVVTVDFGDLGPAAA